MCVGGGGGRGREGDGGGVRGAGAGRDFGRLRLHSFVPEVRAHVRMMPARKDCSAGFTSTKMAT